jgi:hypothetical protein
MFRTYKIEDRATGAVLREATDAATAADSVPEARSSALVLVSTLRPGATVSLGSVLVTRTR